MMEKLPRSTFLTRFLGVRNDTETIAQVLCYKQEAAILQVVAQYKG